MADAQRNPRYVVILAAVASVVLIGGWLLRPREIPASPPPLPSETDLAQLARRAERRSLDDMTRFFAAVAGDVGGGLAFVSGANITAIAWGEARFVTGPIGHIGPQGPVPLRRDGIETEGRAGVTGPNLPLTSLLVEAPALGSPSLRRAASLPIVGDWLLAVWRTAEGPAFASTNFRQSTAGTCRMVAAQEIQTNLSLTRAMVGGGLFTVDGELLGVVLPCGDRLAVLDAASVDRILTRFDTPDQRLLSLYGAVFSPVGEADRPFFKDATGVLVREIWSGSPADAATLQPGDLIVSLDGEPLTGLDDLRPLAHSSERSFALEVQRGRGTVDVTLGTVVPAAADAAATEPGLLVDTHPGTYDIDLVKADSRADRAGLHAGDRLVRVNGAHPRTAQDVRRALTSAGAAPLLLEIARGERHIAVVLP